PDEIEAMDQEAILRFRNDYGIDFGAVAKNALGIRVIPGLAQMVPILNDPLNPDGTPARNSFIVVDTKFDDRVGSWIHISFGAFVFFTSNGFIDVDNVPNDGAQFTTNSIWFHGFSMFAKKEPNFPQHRELVKNTSYQLGQLFDNQW